MKKIGASAVGAIGSIAVLMLFLCPAGFVRIQAQNETLGDTASGETYSAANTVPNVLFKITVGGAFAGAIIPLVSGFPAKGVKGELGRTVPAPVTWIPAVGLPIAGAIALATEPITRALPGVHRSPEEPALVTTLLRAFALRVPLYGLSAVLIGILQAHKRFLLPALAPMLSSIVMIAVFAAFAQAANGKQGSPGALTEAVAARLGQGTTVGAAASALPQTVSVARIVKLRPASRFPDGVARWTRGLIGVGLDRLFVQQVQIATIMTVTNGFGDTGAYSVCIFANAIYMVPCAVLAVPIAVAVFPRLPEAAALPGRPGLTSLTARSTHLVLNAGIITVALLAILASPAGPVFEILRLARGMGVAMLAIALGLARYVLIYHGSRVLYAAEASCTVILINSLAWLGVCATLEASVAIGINGRRQTLIAAGASVSVSITIDAIGQMAAIRRVARKRVTVSMTHSALIVGVASAIGATLGYMAVRLAFGMLGIGGIGTLASAIVGGVVVLSAGEGTVFLSNRDALRLTGGMKESSVEGSGVEGPDVGEPTSDEAGAQ